MTSSSGHSSEDEYVAPPVRDDAPLADLNGMVELAQICHFCATFRAPLKLSSFTRTVRSRTVFLESFPPHLEPPLAHGNVGPPGSPPLPSFSRLGCAPIRNGKQVSTSVTWGNEAGGTVSWT